jgi:protein-tyrosine phosphatase
MLQNLRDAGIGPLRAGLLYRSDAPAHLDEGSDARLRALGLHTIVDLRRGREREVWPYELDWFGGRRVELPLIGEARRPVNPLNGGLAGFNKWVYEARGDSIAEIVGIIAAPGALPALLHCTAGKDRTGLVLALIQSWLGVPDDLVAADYAASAAALAAVSEEAIEKQKLALGVDVRERPDLLDARPEWIVAALDDMRRRHGTAEQYLLDHGAEQDELRRLRAELVR